MTLSLLLTFVQQHIEFLHFILRQNITSLQAFKQLYNHEWLVQKHRNLTPAAVRARFSNPAQAAA